MYIESYPLLSYDHGKSQRDTASCLLLLMYTVDDTKEVLALFISTKLTRYKPISKLLTESRAKYLTNLDTILELF